MIDLHPDHLEAAYEFLCRFEPFIQWKLPSAHEVAFTVNATKSKRGEYELRLDGTHHILISINCTGLIDSLIKVMAHEMTHLYQFQRKTNSKHYHNAEFKELAKEICDIHGWDYRLF